MQVVFDSHPGSTTKPNEDFVAAGPGTVVVLDGLSAPAELGTGCEHGTPWYVAQLGSHLLRLTSCWRDRPLPTLLEEAIATVADSHRHSCDLTHPGTPSSSVVVLCESHDSWEYLVLFDSTLIIEAADGPVIITDERVLQFAKTEREATTNHQIGTPNHAAAVRELVAAERQHRNQPGGYWVAGAKPEAAGEVVAGAVPAAPGTRAAAMTDGVSCLVEPYGLEEWPSLLDALHQHGPASVISRVRQAEDTDPYGDRWPRYKHSDDASVAFCARSLSEAL